MATSRPLASSTVDLLAFQGLTPGKWDILQMGNWSSSGCLCSRLGGVVKGWR